MDQVSAFLPEVFGPLHETRELVGRDGATRLGERFDEVAVAHVRHEKLFRGHLCCVRRMCRTGFDRKEKAQVQEKEKERGGGAPANGCSGARKGGGIKVGSWAQGIGINSKTKRRKLPN